MLVPYFKAGPESCWCLLFLGNDKNVILVQNYMCQDVVVSINQIFLDLHYDIMYFSRSLYL